MLLFFIGLISGIISGMGIGGGTILIPALVFLVKADQHIAQSVNLLFFIPTAIVALIIHIKNKLIDFKMALPIIIAGIFGAYLGSRLALSLPGDTLRKCFGVFILFIGIYEIFRKGKNNSGKEEKNKTNED